MVTRSSIPDQNTADQNRGKRAQASVGEVSGAGAGAGGGNDAEDYDSDPQGGGGKFPSASPPPGGKGADAPNHGSR